MLRAKIRELIYEQFYENNQGFMLKHSLDTAKKRGVSMNGEYLVLWHATSKKNHKSIMKQEKFNTGTFFADDEAGARFWGERNLNNNYQLMMCLVHPAGVLPHADYWVANGELHLKDHNFWVPKDLMEHGVLKEGAAESQIITNNDNMNEIAHTLGSLIQGMKIYRSKQSSSISYLLIDEPTGKIYGNIEIRQRTQGGYYVDSVSAERGYGPLMYSVAMMDIYPNALMSSEDGNTSDGAYDVWEKFYRRDDIIKRQKKSFVPMDDSRKEFLSNIVYLQEPDSVFKSSDIVDVEYGSQDYFDIFGKSGAFFTKMKKKRELAEGESKKKEFDRVKFYREFYENLSPKEFEVKSKEDSIIIKVKK